MDGDGGLVYLISMFLKTIKPTFALVIIGVISIFLISTVDRSIFEELKSRGSSLSILADLRITSLTFVLLIYFSINGWLQKDTPPKSAGEIKRAIVLGAIWISATIYFVLIKRVWVPVLTTWVDYTAFMVTGLLAEEFLFRGTLYKLSVIVFGTQRFLKFSIPIWITSILFGIQHLGYHHYQFNSASLTQIIYTTIMGLFFCNLREASGSLWPVVLLHFLTNSLTIFRNLGFF